VTAPKILFSTVYPLRTAFELAKAAGCDGVELVVCPESILRGPKPIARLAERTALPIQALHPPLFDLPGWRRDDTMIARLVEIALALRIPTVVVHPPRTRRMDDRALTAFQVSLDRACAQLTTIGSQITLENPGFFRPRDSLLPLWQLPALRRFAELHGLNLTLDTVHAGVSPCPLLESYRIVRGRLAHVHLSDLGTPPPWLDQAFLASYVKHHQLPGTGVLPLGEFLRALARDAFEGDITLELSPVSLQIWDLARSQRLLTRAVEDTRRLLASA